MAKESTERRKHWQAVVAEQESSGKSVREFCGERNLAEQSFYCWRRRLVHEDKPVSFALVETKPAAKQTPKFELALNGGAVLHIPSDVESLRVVFEALRAAR